MFERFTGRARKVVVLAQEESGRLRHNYIGTEHLLLGLIREEDGIAARTLREVGVHLDEAREQVESIVGYGEEGTPPQAPFTPRTNKVLQLALREARQLPAEPAGGRTNMEPAKVADLMRTGLQEAHPPSLEAVTTVLGERLLAAFSAMLEVTVTVSGVPEPAGPPAPTFSVSATFRR